MDLRQGVKLKENEFNEQLVDDRGACRNGF